MSEERTSALAVDADPKRTPRSMTWKPQLAEPGFYRGKVTVYGPDGVLREDETSLVIVESIDRLRSGRLVLGRLRLERHESHSTCRTPTSCTNCWSRRACARSKFPVWFDKDEAGEAQRLLRLSSGRTCKASR